MGALAKWLLLVCAAIAAVLVFTYNRDVGFDLDTVLRSLEGLGTWTLVFGGVVFVLLLPLQLIPGLRPAIGTAVLVALALGLLAAAPVQRDWREGARVGDAYVTGLDALRMEVVNGQVDPLHSYAVVLRGV